MGTRALIGYLDTDGDLKLTSTYNHYDGYPSNLGKGLENFYDNDAKAKEIANVGYISFLDGGTGEWEAKHKERPEVTQLPDNFNDAMMEIAEKIENYGGDYGYIWDNENEEWVSVKNVGIGSMAWQLENDLAHLKGKFAMLPERPDQTMESKEEVKEGTWSVMPERIPEFIKAIEALKEEFHAVVGNDTVFDHLDGAIESAKSLMGPAPEIPGFAGTRDALDALEEGFVRKMQHRAGIIK